MQQERRELLLLATKLNHNVGWVCGVASLSPTQIEGFKTVVVPLYKHCRKSVVHNDLNDYNLIAKPDASDVQAVLDFGDVVMTYSTSQVAPPTHLLMHTANALPSSISGERASHLPSVLFDAQTRPGGHCVHHRQGLSQRHASDLIRAARYVIACMWCVDVQTYTPAVDVACLAQCCCHWSACGWQQASCARQKPCKRTLAMRST